MVLPYNSVMTLMITLHALGASLALLLGPVNLYRTPPGDRLHRRVGRVWVIAMYWTAASSFLIRQLNHGAFSWLHGLSAFTLVTLTIGLWAAMSGRIDLHRGMMRGTYIGVVGAFIGAVVVPQRDIPQLAVHQPFVLLAAVLSLVGVAVAVVWALRVPRGAESLQRREVT